MEAVGHRLGGMGCGSLRVHPLSQQPCPLNSLTDEAVFSENRLGYVAQLKTHDLRGRGGRNLGTAVFTMWAALGMGFRASNFELGRL